LFGARSNPSVGTSVNHRDSAENNATLSQLR
jgi:hypothetical protein